MRKGQYLFSCRELVACTEYTLLVFRYLLYSSQLTLLNFAGTIWNEKGKEIADFLLLLDGDIYPVCPCCTHIPLFIWFLYEKGSHKESNMINILHLQNDASTLAKEALVSWSVCNIEKTALYLHVWIFLSSKPILHWKGNCILVLKKIPTETLWEWFMHFSFFLFYSFLRVPGDRVNSYNSNLTN